jgi:hypothetical protein
VGAKEEQGKVAANCGATMLGKQQACMAQYNSCIEIVILYL